MWEVARGVSHPWRRTSNAVGVAASASGGDGDGGGGGVTAGDVERQHGWKQHQAARDLDKDRNHRRNHSLILARQTSRSGSRKRDKVREGIAIGSPTRAWKRKAAQQNIAATRSSLSSLPPAQLVWFAISGSVHESSRSMPCPASLQLLCVRTRIYTGCIVCAELRK